MNLATIAWKSIRQRGLASSLTALSVALGVMLMVAVLVIFGILQNTFNQRSINYDLIVGAKGDPLQLVLSTVYHISPPIENLPYRYYVDWKKDKRIESAIPLAMGDVTEQGSFPIVGTIPEFFEIDYAPGREFLFTKDSAEMRRPFEAYIGSRVAIENGWGIGAKFKLVHGGADSGHVHNEEFTVVGLLGPTGTPHDKTVYVNLEGFYQIEGHDKPLGEGIKREREFYGEPPLSPEELAAEVKKIEAKYGTHDHAGHDHAGHNHIHELPMVQKQITAILLRCKGLTVGPLIAGELKKGYQAQAVNPIFPMQKLLDQFLRPAMELLMVLTVLIIVVSGIGIFVSIYNSMAARRREIAIMRALGAQRGTVFSIILAESIILCVGGGLLGLALGHGLVFVAAPIVESQTGLIVNPLAFEMQELLLLPALLLLATLVGILPGLTAYRTDVAESLSGS